MKKIISTSIIIWIAIFCTANAQNHYIAIDSVKLNTTIINNGDSINRSSTESQTMFLTIRNSGNETFTGNLALGFSVTNDSFVNIVSTDSSIYPLQPFTPGTVRLIGYPNIGYPNPHLHLRIGGNVVVVWPRSLDPLNTVIATDSVTFYLNINDVGVFSEIKKYQLRYVIYPNPSAETIYFKESENPDDAIEKVSVYNINGILVKSEKLTQLKMSLNGLPRGEYQVKIHTLNGDDYDFKLILQP
jgi:hypothetical protein